MGHAAGDVAAAVAGADGHWRIWVTVRGFPVVLRLVTDTRALFRADGHVVVVAAGVDDGRHVVAGAPARELALTPGGGERAGDDSLVDGLRPAQERAVLESHDLLPLGGERDAEDGSDGCDTRAQVGLCVRNGPVTAESLVPDGDRHAAWRSVDEGDCEGVASNGVDEHHV